ncbi:MAG: hypothetical protein GXP28_01950 [Planctomycetes bacterium]|nr:hypothetical protein [Planctomycetota bacterium]
MSILTLACHYPPGTSKWNKIEHRLFCHITRNWHGIPLEDMGNCGQLDRINKNVRRSRSSRLDRSKGVREISKDIQQPIGRSTNPMK